MWLYKAYCRIFQAVLKAGNYFMGYRMPDYIEGPGCIKRMPELLKKDNVNNILLVTGPNITKRGLNRGLMEALDEAGISYTVFNNIGANPTSDMVEEGVKLYHEKNCQAIIAFGGGSPMDCAKGIGARIARPNKSIAQLQGLLKVFKKIPVFYAVPTTTLKMSSDIISRANYFKRHIVSGEWTYSLQTSATSRHLFSPLVFSYEYMRSSTAAFDSVLQVNPYLYYTMQDQFVPKMQYTYTYTSPSHLLNPVRWQTTISEAGNLLSLGYMAAGKKWGRQGKEMFNNPYAQFVKVETDLVKTWRLTEHSTLVGHAALGAIWAYGNSSKAPYGEQFYVGGANSVRAFTVRSIGPGHYHNDASANIYYLDQTGDLMFQANLEYRPRLFGNLYGALFLDAGNVWVMHSDDRIGVKFEPKNALRDLALGTGVGLRYDMDFLVIRLDWGVGLHVPYNTGFYNVDSFKNSQSLHFAVGYPF